MADSYNRPVVETKAAKLLIPQSARVLAKNSPHLSLGPGIPEPAAAFLPWQGHDRYSFAQDCRVASRGVLGGLHHEYRWERIAA